MDSPSKRESARAKKMLKKRDAYPKSGARIVGRCYVVPDSLIEIRLHRELSKYEANLALY